ncbi:MGMT family protein [Carboxylicivirga caseinilyticus]|uniref:MGMT family protein n=1 Tax=Carboxylicivirga caseinilyticus TaxID=3417572 RepID=UPI003D356EA1|nr:MGMT family protein [Marinilabiliaceae bacterium A049]
MPKNDFFEQVYQVAELIPYGRVTSYGAIARYLGAVRSARMVGWAMNKCGSWHNYIPAHRVVNRNGLLTGKQHFPGGETMKELLANEGVKVEENQIVNFKEVFWDPSVELM